MKEKISELHRQYGKLINTVEDMLFNIVWEEGNKEVLYQYDELNKTNAEIFEVTVYDRHFESYDARIETILKDGTVIVYIDELDENWNVNDFYDFTDKLSFLTALYGHEL